MKTFSNCVIASFLIAISCGSANAAPVTLVDNYWGGNNTEPGGGDSIGGTPFLITSATIDRVGAGGNTLEVVINTDYAGHAGLLSTGYGALFITPGVNAWTPTGVAPYPTDIYQNGDWKYAATNSAIPAAGVNSGSGGLYQTGGGALDVKTPGFGTIVASNAFGDPNNSQYYFRHNQAVQFTPDTNAQKVNNISTSWAVTTGKITFDIFDNHFLGDDFAVAWAITCANDTIQGQVHLASGTPEPATWAMMLVGFAGTGFAGYRRSRKRSTPVKLISVPMIVG